jgi:hypothetical protein
MGKDMIVYVKDPNQRDELKRKYPDVDADFVNMQGATDDMDGMLPMVCINDNGKERCETGEHFIRELAKSEA